MLICPACQAVYSADEPRWRCRCGSYLNLSQPAVFDQGSIVKNDYSLWRYRHVLPLPKTALPVTLGEGLTPLVPVDWSGRKILFKLDYLCPSSSFKNRGTSVLVSQLKAWDVDNVAAATVPCPHGRKNVSVHGEHIYIYKNKLMFSLRVVKRNLA